MAGFDVDLFVIGAGSGGVRAARIAAGYGAKVMIAESDRIGGTCVIRGCVPKKLFVYASRFAGDFADAAGFGWTVPAPRFDWATLRDKVAAEVTRLSGLYRKGLDGAGVAIVEARATLDGPNAVRIAGGRRVSARHVLIATGGRPNAPRIEGVEHAIVSDDVFHLPKLPDRIVIVGGGFIALEFASVFARLGSKVTLVYRGQMVLRGFDDEVRALLSAALSHAGVEIRTRSEIARIERTGEGGLIAHLDDGGALPPADHIFYATGRAPNTAGLGLDTAGIETDQNGAIRVDADSRCPAAPSVFAVGDVTNRVNLTPVAIREGHAVADLLFGGKHWQVNHDNVPAAVFTTPELGTVGMSEEAARKTGFDIELYKTSFRPMRATLAGSSERMFMKLIVDRASDRLLGCHILGDGAAEMVQLVGVVIRMAGTKADLDATMALHPTAAEELVTMRTPWRG